ncbi:MAG: DUF4258 domain-containing protein [Deltaproteobacteria bacterium]|nr:MAG: DUF4258 domain-containing protein [Deltaproteobacteria bacterium]
MKFKLSHHATTVLDERKIKEDWLIQVIENPLSIENDREDPELLHHLGKISDFENRVLRVIIKKETSPIEVITAYFDRKMKGKL